MFTNNSGVAGYINIHYKMGSLEGDTKKISYEIKFDSCNCNNMFLPNSIK